MKITIIVGTDKKGCTYQIKELLKAEVLHVSNDCEFREFYLPSQAPEYCTGCKTCFLKGEQYCPHKGEVEPI